MSKFSQLLREVAHKADFTQDDTRLIVETFLELLEDRIIRGNHVEIPNFGGFKLIERDHRRYYCPKTGQHGVAKDRTKIIFKPYLSLRKAIKNRKGEKQ